MVKRTYSQRNTRGSTSSYNDLLDHNGSGKRLRTDSRGGPYLHTPPPSRGEKMSAGSKHSLKMFDGPVSIPDEAFAKEPTLASKAKNGLSHLFDKASKGRLKPAHLKFGNTIHGSREEFTKTIKSARKSSQAGRVPNNKYLPTPPAEIPNATNQKKTELSPTKTSLLFAKIINDKPPKEAYTPKLYEAHKTSAPRNKLVGDRLPKESEMAQLWVTNQINSPFLRLPREIRDLIYGFALGGNTIHIGFETYRTTFKSNKVQKVVPVFKYYCTVFDRPTNPFQVTTLSTMNISSGFTVLSNICRQMYLETDILPFKLNFVSFSSHNVMFNMLFMERRLSRRQLDAITRLIVPDTLPQGNMLTHLRNVDQVFLGQALRNDNKGWYRVRRSEGEEPEVVPFGYREAGRLRGGY